MRRTALALAALLIATPALAQDIINPGGTNASALSSGTVPASRGGAGTINGALKGNGSGVVSQAACADLSNGATGCSTAYTIGDCSSTIGFQGSGTAGTGQTYSTRVCSYEQIGRQVTVRFTLTATTLGTAAGNLQVAGLPVASVNIASENGACFFNFYIVTGLAASSFGMMGIISPNTSIIGALVSNASTGGSTVTITQSGNTPSVEGFCSYRAT